MFSAYFPDGKKSDIATREASFFAIEDNVIYTPSLETASSMFNYLMLQTGSHNITETLSNPDLMNKYVQSS